MMNSYEAISSFIEKKGWHLVQYIDLGTTADIFVIEKDDGKYALKTARGANLNVSRLRTEYLVLQHLNRTPMKKYVPRVGKWIQEVNGFLMEYLRYPNLGSTLAQGPYQALALILKTLHKVELPTALGIEDDRPNINAAIGHRFRSMFQVVLEDDLFWAKLPADDMPGLKIVQARYETYDNLLTNFETALTDIKVTLTHGDLAGDNIMLTQDGRLVLADWGEARISSALIDIAYLLAYVTWSENDVRQFLQTYFMDDTTELKRVFPTVRILSKLYQYRSCVQSLLWLKEMGLEGLDTLGRKHFERALRIL